MEFEMWRNDSCRATKKKGKKKETRETKNEEGGKNRRNVPRVFSRVFGKRCWHAQFHAGRASTMRATALAVLEEWRSRRVAPRFHASPAAGHRDEKNLITIYAWWGWKKGEGKGREKIGGDRSRSFVRPPRCRRVRRWKDNRLPPLNLLKSD